MDNHSLSNAIHVFIAQHHDNDDNEHGDTEDMPALVPLDARGSQPTQPQQQTSTDVEMNDHDNNHDSDSDRDAHEVEMQTVNNHNLSDHAVPNPSPTPHTSQDHPTVNNRRARVEDDQDDDRDRRHPSQRIGNSTNTTSSAGPSTSSTPGLSSQVPTAAPTPGVRLRGQAPIFNHTVMDETTAGRAHPFRFFQHLMSNNNNNDNNDTGNTNTVPLPTGPIPGTVPAPQPDQDRNTNTPHNQPRARFESFSVTLDIGLGTAFPAGGGEGQPTANAADPNLNANPHAQNPNNLPGISIADFMARLGQAIGLGENGPEGTAAAAPGGGNNPAQGAGGPRPTPGEFNVPAFNLANLAGLGFGFNLDGNGFVEKEDPERARKLVDGLEEVPVGLVRRLERVGGTGGGMGEDETKGGDGGCAICWDRLLGSAEETVHQHETCEKKEEGNERTPEASAAASKPKIVSLPCAHVFHAECLIPWFSRPRQTTCPTCRFNIDPENLTYVSWRRRMRERRERERAEARARGDSENTGENEASQDEIAPPAAPTAAEPADAPLSDAPSVSDQVLGFLSSLGTPSVVPVRSQTPGLLAPNVHPAPTSRSQSQPPASSSPSVSSTLAPSSSHPTSQRVSQEVANDWDTMPGLEDVSDSDDDEEENEEDEDEGEDEDEDEDEEAEVRSQEQEDGIHALPLPPQANEPPIASTPGAQAQAQAQAPRPRQNDPITARTIQTAHGLITFIPMPFNFPFPAAGNGVGVGVQAGSNANANAQVPPTADQGQNPLPNVNANVNTQALPQGHPLGPHYHVQLPHMPEFGAQRETPVPAPANTAANANVNVNSDQAFPVNPFVNPQQAAAITNTEEQLMQHLRSQGFTANEAENFRRSTLTGRQADRLRRGENPVGVHLDLEDEDEDDMEIDEAEMGMLVDLTLNQGGDGVDGEGTGVATEDEQNRQDFGHVMNFLNHAARQAQGQAQAGTQTMSREQRTQGGAAGTPGDEREQPPQPPPQQQQPQPQPQPQPQQQQGQGFPPFMMPGFSFGNIRPEDDRTINDFLSRMFPNLGGPQQQQAQQAQPAQRQDGQPQPQPQAQAQAQEPAAGPNPASANTGGRRQQAHIAFGNVTFGPFTNFGPLFSQVPMFNPNGTGNPNFNGGAGAGQERVKKAWTLPPPPGPTLRQRIERRERDAGLRCYDISCGVGPSDEDPVVSDETIAAGLRQLMIMRKDHREDGKPGVCSHTFHPGCLVSAERVALGGAGVSVSEGGDVEVSCPVCRSTGCVTKQEWEEGILALA